MIKSFLHRYYSSFSYSGLLVAAIFFAASLAPSLLPRTFIVQGVLSGVAFSIGYGAGNLALWLWRYLELPELSIRVTPIAKVILSISAAIIVCFFLWRATIWQNSIRELMEMEPLATAHPWRVGLIAVVLAMVLLTCAGLIRRGFSLIAQRLNKTIPRRISNVVSVILVGALLLSFVDGFLINKALKMADAAFYQLDGAIDDGVEQPSSPLASGSAKSLIPWDTIGRRGKNFIVGGPTQDELSEFWGRKALQPLRVYAGMRSGETKEARANLALQELKRVGAFDRAVLVIATPTGTGWLDPGAVNAVEYLHAGNTAIVATQYSYLPSWMTLLVEPELSTVAARALFKAIYGYWTTLPRNHRPKLYLHGLSLGALGSEKSIEILLILDDIIHGAVWSGPPFPSTLWRSVTNERKEGSPAWLPKYRDGSVIRFTGRRNALALPDAKWGPLRIVYIQHASDPMTFFSPSILYQRPGWLSGERGPDVSPYLRWYPVISFLQLGFDLPMATSVPAGYGHNIAPASYIDAWIEVTDPQQWDAGDTKRLKQIFNQ